MTKIQWTEETWNPIAGCSVVSPGCTNCYAMRRAAPRLSQNPATPHYHGTVKPSKGGYVWTGKIGIAADTAFLKPLRTRKPTMFFVNSMSDLFHENVPDEVIDRIFAIMALCPQHTFQVLTKRSARMREYFSKIRHEGGHCDSMAVIWERAQDIAVKHGLLDSYQPQIRVLPNVWLGVSVEDQTRADERIPDLLATPAAIRFISAEPLLGPVDLVQFATPDFSTWLERLDWVIVGGESGKGARPMHPDWARDIRDQCAAAGVPFFFKQWGEWCPGENAGPPACRTKTGATLMSQRWFYQRITPRESESMHRDDEPDVYRAGTKRAGRLLDGVEHNGFPVSGLPLKDRAETPMPERH